MSNADGAESVQEVAGAEEIDWHGVLADILIHAPREAEAPPASSTRKAAGADSGFEKLVDTLARYWKAGSAEETLLWAQRWFRNRIDEEERGRSLDEAAKELIIQHLLEDFEEELILESAMSRDALTETVWKRANGVVGVVQRFTRGSREWLQVHFMMMQELSNLMKVSKKDRLPANLLNLLDKQVKERGDYLDTIVLNHALALALASKQAKAVQVVIDQLRDFKRGDERTVQAWAVQALQVGGIDLVKSSLCVLRKKLRSHPILPKGLNSMLLRLQEKAEVHRRIHAQSNDLAARSAGEQADVISLESYSGNEGKAPKRKREEVPEEDDFDMNEFCSEEEEDEVLADEFCSAEEEEEEEDEDDIDDAEEGDGAAIRMMELIDEDPDLDTLDDDIDYRCVQEKTVVVMTSDTVRKLLADPQKGEHIYAQVKAAGAELFRSQQAHIFEDAPPLLVFHSGIEAGEAMANPDLKEYGLQVLHLESEVPRSRMTSVEPLPFLRPKRHDLYYGEHGMDQEMILMRPTGRDPSAIQLSELASLLVYKPAGWNCTTGRKASERRKRGDMFQAAIVKSWSSTYDYLGKDDRAGIVHRLDIHTSGPVLVGAEEWSANELQRSRDKQRWYKEYLAVMHGHLPDNAVYGDLCARLKTTDLGPGVGWRTEVDENGGTMAISRFEAVAAYEYKFPYATKASKFTLVRVHIITGRTHQIRVHLQYLAKQLNITVQGLLGDRTYLSASDYSTDVSLCDHFFLHERILEFPAPGKSHLRICCFCPLPDDLRTVLSKMTLNEARTDRYQKVLRSTGGHLRRDGLCTEENVRTAKDIGDYMEFHRQILLIDKEYADAKLKRAERRDRDRRAW
mmetsp:Transcript_32083/g.73310  ORF Transcript_32083/g.73310 Transcript_32083/m.73310 type:complete len:854 (+) Transcript_32083:105-2666(+)